jgi:hypothetical protein
MKTLDNHRALPPSGKIIIALAIVAFLLLQGWVLLGPGGILSKYTFVQGFTVFNDLMLADPLTTAGLIDLVVLEIVFIVVLVNGLPRGPSYPWLVAGFLIVLAVYPGLAGLGFLFFYWRRIGQFRP